MNPERNFIFLLFILKSQTNFFIYLIDNVTLHLDGVLYFRVVDPYKVTLTGL